MRGGTGAIVAACGVALLLGAAAPLPPASAAPAGPTDGLEYVALGDSYSAGFGLTPFSDSSPFPGTPNGCYQAEANYPHLIAGDLGLTLTDQTCSGAISANVGYKAGVSIPSPPVTGPLLGLPTSSEPQTTASGMVAPDVQSGALSASTDIVTIGIGGNDLGFASIAMACIRASADTMPLYLAYESIDVENCKEYFDDQATYPDAYLKDRLANFVVPRVEATLERTREAAPNAQVFVVGYPQIAPDDATDACFTAPGTSDAVPLSGVDLNFVNEIEHLLNNAVEAAALENGAHYIPTWDDTAEHTLCTVEPWIWGLTAYVNFSGSCEPGYINGDADGWICVKLGALHPNAGGVENMRQLVAAHIPTAFYTRIIDGSLEPGGTMTVEGGGFQPDESVELALHSTPVTIATMQADASGGFSGASESSDASGPAMIAATGADLAAPVVAGGLLVLIGAGLILLRRRSTT
ncbi:MAG: SGNH/GDSL hydrolase family protein [Leucobacter sp.]